MKSFVISVSFLLAMLSGTLHARAQGDSANPRYQVAVFVPLYLDSAFDAIGEYRFGKNFPKFINPGLEFYEGIQLAVDSLNRLGAALDVYIYDTRSSRNPISRVVQSGEFSTVDLIIGHVTNTEVRQLSEIARTRNIPFVNANIPNAAGTSNNPSLIILNSTLKTHCEAIYRFLQKNYLTTEIIYFSRRGSQEDILKRYFTDLDKSTASLPLRIKYITLNDNFTTATLRNHLDSNRLTMCIAGSLSETFGKNLAVKLAELKDSYPVRVMGMPTWDGIDWTRKEYKGLEVFYTTPFYNAKTDRITVAVENAFRTNYYSRPTDMYFRGYECMLRFGKLLLDHGHNVGSSVGEKKYNVFTDYDIQPVFLERDPLTLDYFENRKLYFIKKESGIVKAVY